MKTGIYAIACPGDAAFIRRRKRFGACLRSRTEVIPPSPATASTASRLRGRRLCVAMGQTLPG